MAVSLQKIGRTNLKFDLERVQAETKELLKIHPIDNITNQLSMTHRPDCQNPFYDGVGSLYDYNSQKFHTQENEFSEFNEALVDTYFFEIYKAVKSWSPFAIGRMRLMRLNPKSCLSMHKDPDIRLHLPIFTSSQAYMVFADSTPVHIPADGYLYWTNTLGLHSVLNGHQTEARYHLVFSAYANSVNEFDTFFLNQMKNLNAEI